MPLNAKVKVARLEQDCIAEDAETLLEWLVGQPQGKLNLKDCTSLHTAILQVMLVCKPTISHWPDDSQLANFLRSTRLTQ